VLFAYLQRLSGYTRQQLTKLIGRYRQARHLHPPTRASRTIFKSRFGTQDIALLAQLDALHNSLSGPAPHMQGMIIGVVRPSPSKSVTLCAWLRIPASPPARFGSAFLGMLSRRGCHEASTHCLRIFHRCCGLYVSSSCS